MAIRYLANYSGVVNLSEASWALLSGDTGGESAPGPGDTAILDTGNATLIVDTVWMIGDIQASSGFSGNLVAQSPINCNSISWAGNKLHLAKSNVGELILPRSKAAGSAVNFDPWGGASYAPQNLQWIGRNGTSMGFAWSPVPGAVSYRLQSTTNGTSWSTRNAEFDGTSYSYAASGSGTFWAFRVAANLPGGGYGPWSVIEFDKVTPDFQTPFVPLAPQPITIGSIDATGGSNSLEVNIWTEIEATGDIEISPAGNITVNRDANGKVKLFGSQDQNVSVYQTELDYTIVKSAGVLSFATTSGTIQTAINRTTTEDPRDVTLLDLVIGAASTMTLADTVTARSTVVSSTLNIASGTTLDTYSITENSGAAANNLGTIRVHTGNAAFNGSGTRGNVVYWGASAPATPTGFHVDIVIGQTGVGLAWNVTPNADSYTIEKSTDQNNWTTEYTGNGGSSSFPFAQVSGLTQGTRYYFRIKASNAAGDSAWSAPISHLTGGTAPAPPPAPTGLSATAMSPIAISVTWSSSTGATSYTLEKSTNQTDWSTEWTGTGTFTTVSGLGSGTTYYFRVKASNANGDSGWSNIANATTHGTTPPPPATPTNFTATSVNESQINLSWNASSGATGYKLERSTNQTNWTEIFSGNALTYNATGLNSGTTYYFRLSAHNAAMAFSTFVYANALTLESTTPAPTGLTISNPTVSSLQIAWNSVDGASSYRLERSENGTTGWSTVYTGTGTSYNNTGLTAGTMYYYRAIAVNTGGDSPASPVASKMTLSAAPTGVTATAINEAQIGISWNDATGASTYTVEWSLTGSGGWTALAPVSGTTATHASLAANTTYYYRVKATNPSGDSAWSATVSEKTAPAPPASFTATVPPSPQGQSQINLAWSASAGAIAYLVEVSATGSSGWTQIYSGTSLAYVHSGLTPNTRYYYRISAGN